MLNELLAVDLARSVRLMIARVVLCAALIHRNICPCSLQHLRVTILHKVLFHGISRSGWRIVVLLRSVGRAPLAQNMSVKRVLGLHLGRLLGGSYQILLQGLPLAPLLLLRVQLGVEGVGQDVADSSLWRVDLVDISFDLCQRLGHFFGLRKVLHTAARQLLVHVVSPKVSPYVLVAPCL